MSLNKDPRSILIEQGPDMLSDSELLAVVLQTGTSKKNVFQIANDIIESVPIENIYTLTLEDWMQFEGVGKVKAGFMQAVFELNKRSSRFSKLTPVKSADDAMKLFYPCYKGKRHEEFWVLYLNHANKYMRLQNIGKGGRASVVVDPKMVFESALRMGASKIILSHNHPSGNLRASQSDVKLTKRFERMSKILEVELLDHLIIHEDEFITL